MLLLTATTQTLELATTAATTIHVTVSYVDITTTAFSPGSQDTIISTATTTTILAAPAASTQRQVKQLTVTNLSATRNQVSVKKDVSATEYVQHVSTLGAYESLQYTDGRGWATLDSNGAIKQTVPNRQMIDGRAIGFYKPGTAADTIGYWYCHSKDAGVFGAWAPGTPGVTGRATDGTTAADAGCIRVPNAASGTNYLTSLQLAATVAHHYWLFDVLWVNSGLTVTTTGSQAVNSVALPARDDAGSANGAGCWIGVLTTTANTNAAVINNSTVTYTNSGGTGSRTATLANLVGAQFPATPVIGTIVWFSLAAGDVGVQSIQSITLGTSLGAGAISMVIARPLCSLPATLANVGNLLYPAAMLEPGIRLYSGVCPLLVYQASATTATTVAGTITVMER